MNNPSAGHDPNPGRYQIRLNGHLAPRWASWFDGMTLTSDSDGTTVIEGPVVDQSALHGLLTKLRDTGLPLISVTPSIPSYHHPPHQKEIDMTTTAARTSTGRLAPTDWTRKYSRAAGIFYLVTFAASMPAVFYFLAPILTDPNYIVGPGADARVAMGCLLDVITALAGIGSAVAVFPVVRRQNEGLALGFVTSRMFEAAVIMIGVVSLLAVVTLRQEFAGAAGADQSALLGSGHALVAIRDWTFQFGPNLSAGINALLFGTLLYRSRLVPRIIPAVGLIGAPLLLAVTVAAALGFVAGNSPLFGLAAPVALWEVSIGTWMLVKGFKPSPLTAVA